jgi:SAM-dependent methyltransferase
MFFIEQITRVKRIFNFNLVERDIWVSKYASSVPAHSLVLDVGAGSCPYRNLFSHCDYKTQDFAGLKAEQLRDSSGYGEIDYYCDATKIPVPDNSIDVILCTEVLEHVTEPIIVIEEFSRILKAGGLLLITAPLGSGIHQAPYHFYGGYTPYWYQYFLSRARFSDIKIEANGGFFKHYSQESIRFVRMTVPWKMKINIIFQILWIPIWLLLSILLYFIFPVICNLMDNLDEEKNFTIGYHVTAVKSIP